MNKFLIDNFYQPGDYAHEVMNMTPTWRYWEALNISIVVIAILVMFSI